MDKKLIREIKEQEKDTFSQKLKDFKSNSKGFWLIRFIGVIINLFVSLLFSWIFKTELDTSNLFDDITNDKRIEHKNNKIRVCAVCFLMIILLLIIFLL